MFTGILLEDSGWKWCSSIQSSLEVQKLEIFQCCWHLQYKGSGEAILEYRHLDSDLSSGRVNHMWTRSVELFTLHSAATENSGFILEEISIRKWFLFYGWYDRTVDKTDVWCLCETLRNFSRTCFIFSLLSPKSLRGVCKCHPALRSDFRNSLAWVSMECLLLLNSLNADEVFHTLLRMQSRQK